MKITRVLQVSETNADKCRIELRSSGYDLDCNAIISNGQHMNKISLQFHNVCQRCFTIRLNIMHEQSVEVVGAKGKVQVGRFGGGMSRARLGFAWFGLATALKKDVLDRGNSSIS